MELQTIKQVLQNHKSDLTALGVQQLHLFGSAARGQSTDNSDLDFLVELEIYSLQNFMELKFSLEHWFGKTVDLGTLHQLKPAIRDNVEKDLLRVA